MAYIHSSPWIDAAAYGGALGDKLAQALIQLPMIKKQMEMQQQQAQASQQQQQFQNTMAQKHYALDVDRNAQLRNEGNARIDLQTQREWDLEEYHKQQEADRQAARIESQKTQQQRIQLGTALQQERAKNNRLQAAAAQQRAATQRALLRKEQSTGAKPHGSTQTMVDPVTLREFPLSMLNMLDDPIRQGQHNTPEFQALRRAADAAFKRPAQGMGNAIAPQLQGPPPDATNTLNTTQEMQQTMQPAKRKLRLMPDGTLAHVQ